MTRNGSCLLVILGLALVGGGCGAATTTVAPPRLVFQTDDDKEAAKQVAGLCTQLGLKVEQDASDTVIVERKKTKFILMPQMALGPGKNLRGLTVMVSYGLKPEAKGSPKMNEFLNKLNDTTTLHFALANHDSQLVAVSSIFFLRELDSELFERFLEFMDSAPDTVISKATPELMQLMK
jgi:hypothetical protein